MSNPVVSVVIPTRNRPDTLLRAVRSVLVQTLTNIEIIVVIDGPDENTERELNFFDDYRLKIITLSECVGGSEARNIGTNNATAEWIAFLDDDDEWFPKKLEIQLNLALSSRHPLPIIGCRMLVRTPSGDFVLPRRLPYPSEHISEYLMLRRSLFHGEGLLQTSMLLVKKDILLLAPFTKGLLRHQETDFLIRAFNINNVGLEMSDDTLGIWYKDDNRPSVSKTGGWEYSFNWIKSNRRYMTKKAYSSFILTAVSAIASHENEWAALPKIVREALKNGQPTMWSCVILIAMWIIPQKLRVKMRTNVLKKKLLSRSL